jgi:hypothetical protein
MSEIINNLPIDSIPLGAEEKDVFEWLYPKKTETQEESLKQTTSSFSNIKKNIEYFIPIGLISSVLMFCAIYPKLDKSWQKLIPFQSESILFSLSKVFTIYFVLIVFYFGILLK